MRPPMVQYPSLQARTTQARVPTPRTTPVGQYPKIRNEHDRGETVHSKQPGNGFTAMPVQHDGSLRVSYVITRVALTRWILVSSTLADFTYPLSHGDDRQNGRVTQGFGQQAGIGHIEVFGEPVRMEARGLLFGER
jgi:hypothetical protein